MTAAIQGFGVTLWARSDINRRVEFRCVVAIAGNEFR